MLLLKQDVQTVCMKLSSYLEPGMHNVEATQCKSSHSILDPGLVGVRTLKYTSIGG